MKTLKSQRGSVTGLAFLAFWLLGLGVYADQYYLKGNDILAPLTSQTIVQDAGKVAQNAK